MKNLKTLVGVLRYINQYKQLIIEIDDTTYETILNFENRKTIPLAWKKKDDNDEETEEKRTKVRLTKYIKVDAEIMRIEELIDRKVVMKIQ